MLLINRDKILCFVLNAVNKNNGGAVVRSARQDSIGGIRNFFRGNKFLFFINFINKVNWKVYN